MIGSSTYMSADFIKNVIAGAPIPMILYSSVDGRVFALSKEWTRATGYTADDLPDISAWTKLAYRDRAQEMELYIRSVMANRAEAVNLEISTWTKDGSQKIFLMNSKAFNGVSEYGPLRWTCAIDITHHRETGRALRESEERFRALADAVPHMVWCADARGHFDYYNRRTLEFLQKSSIELSEKAWYESIHPEDLPKIRESWQKALLEGVEFMEEFRILSAKEGRYYWHLSHGVPIKDPQGKILRWYGTNTEIDARKRMDEALRQSERRFFLQASELETLYQTAPVGLCVVDKNYKILKLNQRLADINGIVMHENPDRQSWDFPADIEAQVKPFIRKAFETGEPVLDCEIRGKSPEAPGEYRWWLASYSPIKDVQGQTQSVHCIIQDISERKRGENALRDSEKLFRHMADNAPVLIWITVPDGNCIYFNKQWYDFTGFSEDQAKGFGWLDCLHPEDRLQAEKIFLAANKQGESIRFDYRLRRKDGVYRWVISSAAPRTSENGEFLGYIGSVIDIHDMKTAEQRLFELNQNLEERVKQRTLSLEQQTVQLRKLAAQLTHVEQNERKRLAELIHDHLQQLLVATKIRVSLAIKDSHGRKVGADLEEAEKILNEAIEVSRSLTAELRPPVLYEDGLISALKWLSRTMGKQYPIEIVPDLDEKAEPVQEQIKAMLYESVRELLFNAVKYAKADKIYLSVRPAAKERIHLQVRDQGSGFDVKVVNRDANSSKGFGLFSIRERLKVLGGDMKIHSEPGKGTTVDLYAPLEIPGETEPKEAPQPSESSMASHSHKSRRKKSGPGIKVLVADDHRIVREGITNLLLEHCGIEVIGQAGDGAEALEKARELRPDVIIMDLNMPRMNGIEATRAVASEMPAVKVIGLSIHNEEDIAEAMIEAGAFTYLNKAGDPKKLIAAIMQCASVPPASGQ